MMAEVVLEPVLVGSPLVLRAAGRLRWGTVAELPARGGAWVAYQTTAGRVRVKRLTAKSLARWACGTALPADRSPAPPPIASAQAAVRAERERLAARRRARAEGVADAR